MMKNIMILICFCSSLIVLVAQGSPFKADQRDAKIIRIEKIENYLGNLSLKLEKSFGIKKTKSSASPKAGTYNDRFKNSLMKLETELQNLQRDSVRPLKSSFRALQSDIKQLKKRAQNQDQQILKIIEEVMILQKGIDAIAKDFKK